LGTVTVSAKTFEFMMLLQLDNIDNMESEICHELETVDI